MGLRLVVHYLDGRVIKGTTVNFNPASPSFDVSLEGAQPKTPSEGIWLKEVKAVFFVRSFSGDHEYNERKEFGPGDTFQGRRIKIVFVDGEELVGSSSNYTPGCEGFFFFPCDNQANTIKAWIPRASIKSAGFLP